MPSQQFIIPPKHLTLYASLTITFIINNYASIENMSESFGDRQKGFEAKFKMDQETEFKVNARRSKLLGLWLAEKLGLPESQHDSYAKEVIVADLEEPGDEDIMRKVMKDIEQHEADITDSDIRLKLDEFHKDAIEQIAANK